jgi:hypothetical protein
MMRRLLLSILICCCCSLIKSQTITISGVVHDKTGTGIANAIVKLVANNSTLAFNSTDEKGNFSIKVAPKSDKLHLIARHLNYGVVDKLIDARTQRADIAMEESSTQLHEVIVKAAPVRLAGDTIKYQMNSFAGKGDVTLEDGIKKLPGIAVSKEGKISYMGKDISQFKIEGLDMLGGQYNVATRNIPLHDVTTVEVMRHHHRNKIDKEAFSNDVALNIKLAAKAKGKFFVMPEVGTGYESHKMLYKVGLVTMEFNTKFQTIMTSKSDNVNEGASSFTLIDHFGNIDITSLAKSALNNFGTSTPPVSTQRYENGTNVENSVHAIKKYNEDETLDANISYSYKKTDYSYRTESRYFTDTALPLVINEQISPSDELHTPSVNMQYWKNKADFMLENETRMTAQFEHSAANLWRDADNIFQHRSMELFGISNGFKIDRKRGSKRWNFESMIKYATTPTNNISYLVADSAYTQHSHSHTFYTNESSSFIYDLNPNTTLYFPIAINLTYDRILTDLYRKSSHGVNDLCGVNLKPSLTPKLEYHTTTRSLTFNIAANIYYSYLNYHNPDKSAKMKLNRAYIDPGMNIHWQMNGASEVNLSSSYSHNAGDILSLLIHPIQTNYLSQYTRSGILSKSNNFTSYLEYTYQDPISFWFLNMSATYNLTKVNLLNSQYVTNQTISNASILDNNRTHSANTSFSISKYLMPIATKLSVSGGYGWNKQKVVQQNIPMNYYGRNYNLNGNVNFNPYDWFEMNYSAVFNQYHTRYNGTSNSIKNYKHVGSISYYPTSNLRLYTSLDYIKDEIADSKYKDATFFDTGIVYKQKKMILKLELKNIFNVRHYAYSLLSGVNSYSYDYQMRGREVLFTFSLK